jgi:hypothetical protein
LTDTLNGAILGSQFATVMNNSVAVRLSDDVFMTNFNEWRNVLGDDFPRFMRGGVASRLCNEEFDKIAKKWLALLGAKAFTRIFGIPGFVSRVMDTTWAARLEQLRLREKDGLYTFLNGRKGKKLDDI